MRGNVRLHCLLAALLWLSACEVSLSVGGSKDQAGPASIAAPANTPAPAKLLSPPQPVAPPRPTRVTGGPATVTGKLPAARVSELIARHHNELRFCQASKPSAPDLVEAKLKLVASATGAISTASLEDSNTHDSAIVECLTTAARRWSLPAVKGAGDAEVTYPIRLERVDDSMATAPAK